MVLHTADKLLSTGGDILNREYLTPETVMKRLKISRRTVLDWLRQGKLPGQKIGSQWRVDADGLEAFLNEDKQQEAVPDKPSEFGTVDVLRLTGINRKTLHYWVQEGVIAPSILGAYGKRRHRIWSFRDVVALRVVQRLRQSGIAAHPIRIIRLLVDHIQGRDDLENIDPDTLLITDGHEIWETHTASPAFGDLFIAVSLGKVVKDLLAAIHLS